MITLKQWMEIVGYRITEGSDYNLFSPDAYALTSWNGEQDGHSLEIIFDTKTQVVYCVEACDYKRERAYRLFNPDYADVDDNKEAWDTVDWVDLEVSADWIEKAQAIVAGRDYDTRVQVPVEFSDEDLLNYMKMAHERDITFNQLIEEALREAIKTHLQDK